MKNVQRGRELVEAGIYRPDGVVDCFDVLAYLDQQYEQVQRTGRCEACRVAVLVRHHARSEYVCPRTYRPCPARRLAALVEIYGSIFRESK